MAIKKYIPMGRLEPQNMNDLIYRMPPKDFVDALLRTVQGLGGEIIPLEGNTSVGYYLSKVSTVLVFEPYRSYEKGFTLLGSSDRKINKTMSKLEKGTRIKFMELRI